MSATLNPGSTVPLFISDFEGAEFFDSPQEGGGLYAAGQEDTTNILLFPDTNDVAVGGDEVDIISGGAGGDNIMGAEGTDFMFGGTGDDIVRGGAGDDVIVGNEGSDVLISGSGSDIYEFFADQFVAGDKDTILDFEIGKDAIVVVGSTDVDYNSQTGLVSVDGAGVASLEAGLDLDVLTREDSAVIFSNGGTVEFPLEGGAALDDASPQDIENSSSSLAPDSTVPLFISDFEGAEFFDSPQEGGGLFAAGPEDTTNILTFEDLNDVAVGGDEVDIISGGAGGDNIMGAEGTDFMFGGTGDDIVRGGAGDDVIVGNEGSDVLISGSGSDIYEFFADQFVAGDVDVILDFKIGKDAIVVVGSTDVDYNSQTGLVSVDGSEVASLEAGLNLDILIRADSSVIS